MRANERFYDVGFALDPAFSRLFCRKSYIMLRMPQTHNSMVFDQLRNVIGNQSADLPGSRRFQCAPPFPP